MTIQCGVFYIIFKSTALYSQAFLFYMQCSLFTDIFVLRTQQFYSQVNLFYRYCSFIQRSIYFTDTAVYSDIFFVLQALLVMNKFAYLDYISASGKFCFQFLCMQDLQEYSLDNYVDSHANITVLSLMVDYSSSFCFLSKEYINLKRAVLHDAIILHANISRETEMLKHKNVRVSMRDIVRNVSCLMESFSCRKMKQKTQKKTEKFQRNFRKRA